MAANNFIGCIDSITRKNAEYIISGWAAEVGKPTPVVVHFIVRKADSDIFVKKFVATNPDVEDEQALRKACQIDEAAKATFHRFNILIPGYVLEQYSGYEIHLLVNGDQNYPLAGKLTVPSKKCCILALGDSITAGNHVENGYYSWRTPFQRKLIAAGKADQFEMIGPYEDAVVFEPEHNIYPFSYAVGGATSHDFLQGGYVGVEQSIYIKPLSEGLLLSEVPDVAMVLLGANDIQAYIQQVGNSKNCPADFKQVAGELLQRIDQIISLLREKNSDMHIFLSQVPEGVVLTDDSANDNVGIHYRWGDQYCAGQIFREGNALLGYYQRKGIEVIPITATDYQAFLHARKESAVDSGLYHFVHPNLMGCEILADLFFNRVLLLLCH